MMGKAMKPVFVRMDSCQDGMEWTTTTTTVATLASTTLVLPPHTDTPHLLRLPREIRDRIYDFLHRPVQMRWELNKRNVHCVALRVPNAPIAAVFSTCTRLREEYSASRSLRNLAGTLSTTRATPQEAVAADAVQCHAVCDGVVDHASAAPLAHVGALLAALGTLTVLVDNKRSLPSDPEVWREIETLEDMLEPFKETLGTVRVGVHQRQDAAPLQMGSRAATKGYTDPELMSGAFMPVPNSSFMGKPMVQHAAGYRLQLVLLQPHPSDEEDFLERFHRHKTGVYVFSNLAAGRGRDAALWTREEATRCFAVSGSWFSMQRCGDEEVKEKFQERGVDDGWIREEYGGEAGMREWCEML